MRAWARTTVLVGTVAATAIAAAAQEGGPINPFGESGRPARDDAAPGRVVLSDGAVHSGRVFLTRDARLKVLDRSINQQRQIPLRAVRRIDCTVEREWLEPEWRFLANASDEKVLTGRSYPAREYVHTITLADGRTIRGPLTAIVYVQAEGQSEPTRFILHQRDKGAVGAAIETMRYVRSVELGETAQGAGRTGAGDRGRQPQGPRPSGSR